MSDTDPSNGPLEQPPGAPMSSRTHEPAQAIGQRSQIPSQMREVTGPPPNLSEKTPGLADANLSLLTTLLLRLLERLEAPSGDLSQFMAKMIEELTLLVRLMEETSQRLTASPDQDRRLERMEMQIEAMRTEQAVQGQRIATLMEWLEAPMKDRVTT